MQAQNGPNWIKLNGQLWSRNQDWQDCRIALPRVLETFLRGVKRIACDKPISVAGNLWTRMPLDRTPSIIEQQPPTNVSASPHPKNSQRRSIRYTRTCRHDMKQLLIDKFKHDTGQPWYTRLEHTRLVWRVNSQYYSPGKVASPTARAHGPISLRKPISSRLSTTSSALGCNGRRSDRKTPICPSGESASYRSAYWRKHAPTSPLPSKEFTGYFTLQFSHTNIFGVAREIFRNPCPFLAFRWKREATSSIRLLYRMGSFLVLLN